MFVSSWVWRVDVEERIDGCAWEGWWISDVSREGVDRMDWRAGVGRVERLEGSQPSCGP